MLARLFTPPRTFGGSLGLHGLGMLPVPGPPVGIPRAYGEVRKGSGLLPKAYVPDPKLEAALENLKRAIGKAGGA
jgi:hypothetical protein